MKIIAITVVGIYLGLIGYDALAASIKNQAAAQVAITAER